MHLLSDEGAVDVDSGSGPGNDFESAYDVGIVDNEQSRTSGVPSNVTLQLQSSVSLVGKENTGAMVTCMGMCRSDLTTCNAKLRGVRALT